MATESRGRIAELFARRVPQIVGVYIGACWVLVEMGEWFTGQVGASPNLVAYVFVLMIALLPSVAVLAWNHGAPGRDRWPRYEKLFVPANLIAAIVAVVAFFGYSPPGTPGSAIAPAESALVQRTLVDETGQARVFKVAREGHHRLVAAFFWRHAGQPPDAPPDWRQFAVPWLLEIALDPDPLMSLMTPFWAELGTELRAATGAQGVNEPQALALRLARTRNAKFALRGSLEPIADGWRLFIQVLDTDSGLTVTEEFAEGPTVVVAVDRLAELVRPHLTGVDAIGDRFVRVPLEESTTPVPDALESAIAGMQAQLVEGDPESAIDAYQRALEIDPTFALAAVQLSHAHRATGDFEAALEAAQRALAFEYKLSTRNRFAMKANQYALAGDYETAMRVLRMWTEVHPEDLRAWMTLAQNQTLLGQLDEATASLESARGIAPDNTYIERQLARIEQLSGHFEAAAERLRDYIAERPEEVAARIELGSVLARSGQPDAAREVLRDASLLGGGALEARLALAELDLRQGRLDDAARHIDSLLDAEDDPNRRARILQLRYEWLFTRGRPAQVLFELERDADVLRPGLQPADYWLKWAELSVRAHLELGDGASALAAVERAERELGDPLSRFLTIEHVRALIEVGAPDEELQAQVERARFFETQFAFGGAHAMIDWTESLVLAHAGEDQAALEAMQGAGSHFGHSSLTLQHGVTEMMDLDLARRFRATGQLAEALETLDSILAQHPSHAEARLERAELRAESGNRSGARDDVEQVLAQWSDADPGFVHLQRARSLRASLD